MDSYDSHVMSLARTQYRSIADTLDGSVIVGNEHGYFIEERLLSERSIRTRWKTILIKMTW